ncbi:MAG TPA: VOC family protein [Dongiaceae bacterium]
MKRPASSTRAKPSPVPAGYNSVTAYLIVQDASAAIVYYEQVFGAKEELRMPAPGGKVGHCEMKIGDSKIMLADEFPGMNAVGPKTMGGSPITIMVYVTDVDDVVERAVAHGGRIIRPVKDQFYGDRSGAIEDPQGHIWHVATHVEDVSMKELQRRSEAAMASMPEGSRAEQPEPEQLGIDLETAEQSAEASPS